MDFKKVAPSEFWPQNRECSGSTPRKEALVSPAERQDVCPVGSLMLGVSHLHILNIVAETPPPTSW